MFVVAWEQHIWNCFNRTFMELKLNTNNMTREETVVLIVPLWN